MKIMATQKGGGGIGGLVERPGKLCPLIGFHRAVGGTYKLRILWELAKGPRRYGELRRSLIVATLGTPVTPRTLSRELKELEQRGLLRRKQYPVVPPKVEYTLSKRGQGLVPVMIEMVKWWIDGGRDSLPLSVRR
jgi:DNA-binding HxlR family transcriptional regulator